MRALCLVVAIAVAAAPPARAEERPKPAAGSVPTYTNEDLDRVRPYRDQTGVASRPAVPSGAGGRSAAPAAPPRGEAAWRKEAARVRAQVAALEEQARRLREQAEREQERRGRPGNGRSDARARWARDDARERRLREVEARARSLQADLEDRARQEGALPGWLR
jgi:hypothetical protein